MSLYKTVVFPILKRIDPERVHYLITDLLKLAFRVPIISSLIKRKYTLENPALALDVFGLHFKNPIGLAAGFDKNAKFIDEMSALGFGFIEIGTVTPKPQIGNDKPRLFRLLDDQAIINRMGFNNEGSLAAAELLRKRKSNVLVGGNIGKNKVTPNEDAISDYEKAFDDLYPYVDYFVVNVSSPNTPGLRELQEKEPLSRLLLKLKERNAKKEKPRPILLKIAPDLSDKQLDDIIEITLGTKIDGLIATNTTIERSALRTSNSEINKIGAGGLSGKPLKMRSTEVIKYLHKNSKGAFPIIGVGGIYSAEDALEKLNAGASLIQIYSGFIYEGPGLIKKICKGILESKK